MEATIYERDVKLTTPAPEGLVVHVCLITQILCSRFLVLLARFGTNPAHRWFVLHPSQPALCEGSLVRLLSLSSNPVLELAHKVKVGFKDTKTKNSLIIYSGFCLGC